MTLFRLETLEERVNKLISPGRHGRYDIYKIQLLDDGSVVSAARHELGKGMPDSPDPSMMAELFEETVLNKKKTSDQDTCSALLSRIFTMYRYTSSITYRCRVVTLFWYILV